MFFRKQKPKNPLQEKAQSQAQSKTSVEKGGIAEKEELIPEISTISEGLEITGSIVSKGKIRCNGKIKGTLDAKLLYVGESGFIDGKVSADEAVVLGRVKGSLKGKKVRLASTSKIEGDTHHEVIAIEDGAIYEGSIKRIKP